MARAHTNRDVWRTKRATKWLHHDSLRVADACTLGCASKPSTLPRMYFETFAQMKKQLRQMETWFAAAETFATEKKFDPTVLVSMRPRARSVSAFTPGSDRLRHAEARRLTPHGQRGSGAGRHRVDLRRASRAHSVHAQLPRWLHCERLRGHGQALGHAATMGRERSWTGTTTSLSTSSRTSSSTTSLVYAILRHNGVPLGKRDYLGALSQRMP